jgi:hypothetical protein
MQVAMGLGSPKQVARHADEGGRTVLQADPNRIKVRVEMSMEQLQQMAQHRALLRQAGIGQQAWLSRELRRLLGAVGAVWVALGARRKPPSPDLGMESMHSHGQRRESPSLAPE